MGMLIDEKNILRIVIPDNKFLKCKKKGKFLEHVQYEHFVGFLVDVQNAYAHLMGILHILYIHIN